MLGEMDAGSVSVDVRGNIDQLYSDLKKAEQVTKNFDKSMSQGAAKSARYFEQANSGTLRSLIQSSKGFEQASRSAALYGRSVQKASEQTTRAVSGIQGSMAGLRQTFVASASAIAGAIGAREIVQLADSYTTYQNRLKLVTTDTENLAQVTDELYGIANRTRSSFGATTEMFARMAVSSKELGVSQKELLRFTESLNQAVTISGATSQEASAALIQLAQGMASGRLQGDELRSVLEQLPAVADVIAQHLGVTRGELRQMGADGKISAIQIIDAFAAAREELANKFGQTVPTVAQSLEILNNQFGRYIGEANASLSATQQVSQAIVALANNLDTIIPAITTIATVLGVRYVAGAAGAIASNIALAAGQVRTALTAEAVAVAEANAARMMTSTAGAAAAAATSVSGLAVAQGLAARAGAGLVALMGGPWGAAILALGAAYYLASQRIESLSEASEEYTAIETKAAEVRKKSEEVALDLATATGAAAKAAREHAAATREEAQAMYEAARTALFLAQTKQMLAEADARRSGTAPGPLTGTFSAISSVLGVGPNAELGKANANLASARNALADAEKALAAFEKPSGTRGGTPTGEDGKKTKTKASKEYERSEEAAQRELAQLRIEQLQAQMDLTSDAEARADLQSQILAEEKAQRIAEIKANKDLTDAQRKAAMAAIDRLYGPEAPESGDITVGLSLYQQKINRERQAKLNEEQFGIAETLLNAEQDLLNLALDSTENEKERAAIQLKIIDAEERLADLRLAQVEAAEDATPAMIEQAQIERELARIKAGKAKQDVLDAPYVEFADGFANALGRATQSVLALENPLSILRNFLMDLTSMFNEQFIINPIKEWSKDALGMPLAKEVIGEASPIDPVAIKTAGTLQLLDLAAANAAKALAMMSATGGGSGGFLGSLLGIAGSALGGGGGLNLDTGPITGIDTGGILDFTPGFASGTPNVPDGKPFWVGEGGRELMRRRGNQIEVMSHSRSRQFVSDTMRQSAMPSFGGKDGLIGAAMKMMGGNTDRSINFGNIIVQGSLSRDDARRSAKQIASELQGTMARTARQGMRHD